MGKGTENRNSCQLLKKTRYNQNVNIRKGKMPDTELRLARRPVTHLPSWPRLLVNPSGSILLCHPTHTK